MDSSCLQSPWPHVFPSRWGPQDLAKRVPSQHLLYFRPAEGSQPFHCLRGGGLHGKTWALSFLDASVESTFHILRTTWVDDEGWAQVGLFHSFNLLRRNTKA